jgi:exosortase/archaeosortase family protein
MLILYFIDPLSFQNTWKGRLFYLFFLWLFALEFIMGSRNPKPRISFNKDTARVILGFFMLMVPTIYVMEFYLFGLNDTIAQFARILSVGKGLLPSDQAYMINTAFPLSVEYLVIAVSMFIGTLLLLDFEGIRQFSISVSFLGLIGVFYLIDTLRPFASASVPNFLTPGFTQSGFSIQSFVPFISSNVAFFMQKLGYAVQMTVWQDGSVLLFVNGHGYLVYWPCAGVYSLFIYTFVILLFLKNSPMSLFGKLGCFLIGAVGTFFVNILRIVSIIQIGNTSGSQAAEYFHNYYGELFFLGWIVFYLLVLSFVQRLWIRRASATVS